MTFLGVDRIFPSQYLFSYPGRAGDICPMPKQTSCWRGADNHSLESPSLATHDSILTWLVGTFHFHSTGEQVGKVAIFSTFPKCTSLILSVYLSSHSPLQTNCSYAWVRGTDSIMGIWLRLWLE